MLASACWSLTTRAREAARRNLLSLGWVGLTSLNLLRTKFLIGSTVPMARNLMKSARLLPACEVASLCCRDTRLVALTLRLRAPLRLASKAARVSLSSTLRASTAPPAAPLPMDLKLAVLLMSCSLSASTLTSPRVFSEAPAFTCAVVVSAVLAMAAAKPVVVAGLPSASWPLDASAFTSSLFSLWACTAMPCPPLSTAPDLTSTRVAPLMRPKTTPALNGMRLCTTGMEKLSVPTLRVLSALTSRERLACRLAPSSTSTVESAWAMETARKGMSAVSSLKSAGSTPRALSWSGSFSEPMPVIGLMRSPITLPQAASSDQPFSFLMRSTSALIAALSKSVPSRDGSTMATALLARLMSLPLRVPATFTLASAAE